MDVKGVIIRENHRVQDNLTRVCQDLTDEQIHFVAKETSSGGRAISPLVVHIYETIVARAEEVCGINGTTNERLQAETTAALLQYIESAHEKVDEAFSQVTDQQLEDIYELSGREFSGIEMIMGSFSHGQRHIGNIQDIRGFGGFPDKTLRYPE
jgi:uncharacterized damage-inducible protein DinB